MSNRDCAIARDLMPLLIDDVCSEESKAFVSEHVAACADCAAALADMRAEPPQRPPVDETAAFSDALRQVRRADRHKRIKYLLIGLCIALVLFAIGGFTHQALFMTYNTPLALDRYDIVLEQTSRGDVLDRPVFDGGANAYRGTYHIGNVDENGVLYLRFYTSIVLQRDSGGWPPTVWDGLTMRDGTLYTVSGGEPGQPVRINEIRKGTPDHYEVVYRAGDDIPLCDPADEVYYPVINQ